VWHSAIRTELLSTAKAAAGTVLQEAEPNVFLLTRQCLDALNPDHEAWRCPAFDGLRGQGRRRVMAWFVQDSVRQTKLRALAEHAQPGNVTFDDGNDARSGPVSPAR
jgi:hypothetical protein